MSALAEPLPARLTKARLKPNPDMDGRAAVRMAAVTAPFTPINAHQHSFVTPAVSKRRQEGTLVFHSRPRCCVLLCQGR